MSTTISGTSGVTFPDSTSMQTGQQACKAWVKFNGTGTVSIQNSFNVSSITDVATGQYYVNFTSAMPTSEYCVVACSGYDTTYTGDSGQNSINTRGYTPSYAWLINWNDADTLVDCGAAHAAIFSN